ncbi:hypothetical protein [uncultured Hyphomicrobium sp.]|uniref:hypothetical protein n=1 Tax=uncultured Hyphomicrobium sp. TaxID=194373 RepID=UPI0025D97B0A|nr:hypothetical protein [uncultured Hyphomicrobium sp.]
MRVPIRTLVVFIFAASGITPTEANPVSFFTKLFTTATKSAPKAAPSIPKAGTAIVAGEATIDDALKGASRLDSGAPLNPIDDTATATKTEEASRDSFATKAAKKVAEDALQESAENLLENAGRANSDDHGGDKTPDADTPWITEIRRD